MKLLSIILSFIIIPSLYAISPIIDSLGQRSDGSKLFDIWYSIEDLDSGCIEVRFTPITEDDETLTCETFITPSDTGEICSEGSGYHIIWDAGTDVPDREFFENQVRMRIQAFSPGTDPWYCFETEPMITSGYEHSLALKADGTVWAWGDNEHGELGDGTTIQRTTPVQVHGERGRGYLKYIIAITSGGDHVVALREDGTVWTWGGNSKGQLGDGTTIDRHVPIQVHGEDDIGYLSDVVAIAAGRWFTVVLKSDSTVWSWGSRLSLGDGSLSYRYTPVQVHGEDDVGFLTDVVAISCGLAHTIALKSDSTVWTWGWNVRGQLGDGTTENRLEPVQVRGVGGRGHLTNVVSIATGNKQTLVIEPDSSVLAWGANLAGAIGDGTETDRYLPVRVHGVDDIGYIDDIIMLSGSNSSSSALKSDNTVWTWGNNWRGQLGVGTSHEIHTPVQVHGEGDIGFLTDIISIKASQYHEIALKSDGTIWGWGENVFGQLGDGTIIDRHVPIQVHGSDDIGFFNIFD